MSRINTNVPALRAIHRSQNNRLELELRLERLATGLRINRGRDDPAGLIASETLRSQIRGIDQALKNSVRANNVISTAEGSLNEVSTLLLELQSLVLAASNEAGLLKEELEANQVAVDSILDSIDRIGNTASFGGQKLLDGTRAYLLSGASSNAFTSVATFAALIPDNGTKNVTVRITQSAQTAILAITGTNVSGISTTSSTTVELRGNDGSTLLSFASGTTLAVIRSAINNLTPATGVVATVSSPSVGAAASSLVLASATLGSDAFVAIRAIGGNFITPSTSNVPTRRVGVDAGVLIDGALASVKGLRADVRSNNLDMRLNLTQAFGQTLSSATFSIVGGGAIFQITPEVSPNGRLFTGFERVATTTLGTPVTGLLYTLRSGSENDLDSKNFKVAQEIVAESINQISTFRGRLGTLQRNHIDPSINSQRIALENITSSESIIRDADIAVEVSGLTRAQILVQTTQATLQIANSLPNLVLSLLGQ